jgi:hypothetical protein
MFSNECGPMRLKEIGGGSAEAVPSEMRIVKKRLLLGGISKLSAIFAEKTEQSKD